MSYVCGQNKYFFLRKMQMLLYSVNYQGHGSHYPCANYKFDVSRLNMAFFNLKYTLR